MRRPARRMRKEQERVEELRSARFEWVTKWFAALPHDALLVIKENGVVIGKVRKFDVTWRDTEDLYLFLRDDEEYGFGNYSIAAHYDGAFRGKHLRIEVGEPKQWTRGATKAETATFVERERASRAVDEEYERNPVLTTMKILAGHRVFAESLAPEDSADKGPLADDDLGRLLRTLQEVSDEEFSGCCQYLLDNLPPSMVRELFSAYRKA
jgi:hypothetical protein